MFATDMATAAEGARPGRDPAAGKSLFLLAFLTRWPEDPVAPGRSIRLRRAGRSGCAGPVDPLVADPLIRWSLTR